jgi:hypothetical protein
VHDVHTNKKRHSVLNVLLVRIRSNFSNPNFYNIVGIKRRPHFAPKITPLILEGHNRAVAKNTTYCFGQAGPISFVRNEKLAPMVREIGWSHNIVIMERCKDDLQREFYIRMTRKFGWSKNALIYQIENQMINWR